MFFLAFLMGKENICALISWMQMQILNMYGKMHQELEAEFSSFSFFYFFIRL
jgi:hypothetical protein